MSIRTKRIKPFKSFEGAKGEDRHWRITESMYKSAAYQSLTLAQRQLYFEFKVLYYPDFSKKGELIQSNEKNIKFPFGRWKTLYNGNYRGWKRDVQALIDKGFITIVERGKTTRTPNIYAFSDRWQKYK